MDGNTMRGGRRTTRLGFAVVALACLTLVATAFAAEGELSFVECLEDVGSASSCSDEGATVNGLNVARAIAGSPDGKHLYVASSGDDAVAAFSRNSSTGELTFVEAELDGVGGVDGLNFARAVDVSPDGKHVYAVSRDDDAIVAFSRDSGSGALTFVECLGDDTGPSACDTKGGTVDGLDFAGGVTVSPDGKNVYVASALADDEVSTFSRNQTTGKLSFVGIVGDGIGGVDGLAGAHGITTSPDGAHVYVASEDDHAVAAFSRDQSTGELSFVECLGDTGLSTCDTEGGTVDGLDGATGVTASPDGRQVYVSGSNDDSVSVFSRNASSGGLSFVGFEDDGVGGVDGLGGAAGIEVSPDGKHLYVASPGDDALAAFSRNPTTGALSFIGCLGDAGGSSTCDTVGGTIDGLDGARSVTTSLDGQHVATAGSTDGAVASFSREPDVTAPQTTIASGPAGGTADSTPTFSFSSDDPAFTTGFECRTDGGGFGPCTSPRTIGRLAAGSHSFEVRATDTAGNVDPSPALRSFTVLEPSEGKRASVVPKRGKIRVNTPGPGGYRRLVEGELLPIGTKVDAREGRVLVITEYNGRLQEMLFYAGRFQIRQRLSKKPIVEIKLIGKLRCGGGKGAADRVGIAKRKKRGGKGRKLWGKGKKGKYKSKGKRGAATVRGTTWKTEDRCDGSTRFTLKRGKLQIDDFGKPGKRNAVLKGKGRYTAKP